GEYGRDAIDERPIVGPVAAEHRADDESGATIERIAERLHLLRAREVSLHGPVGRVLRDQTRHDLGVGEERIDEDRGTGTPHGATIRARGPACRRSLPSLSTGTFARGIRHALCLRSRVVVPW